MKALILAAGYATRLYPLTKEFPKPLLTIGQKPIIDYIIDKLETVEPIDEIIVITNSKFITQFRKWRLGIRVGKRISLVDDLTKDHATKRGAIGDMNFAVGKKRIKDGLLVIGGDNLFDGDINGFLAFAKTKKNHPVIGAYDIGDKKKANEYGVMELNKENRVIDFREKPKNPKSTLVAMCLYWFPKERLALIQEYLNSGTKKTDASGLYIDWLRKKVAVYGFVFGGRWYDIGHHRFYNEAKLKFK
ncbi:MAG: nucleotidyltransferase family protein [Candidatus Omnitrophica bacterium]|nr:nucleotidyltransferase family protein [Candidatus Omnitrophota bacterium]